MAETRPTPFLYLIADSRLFRRNVSRDLLVPQGWSPVGKGAPEWGGRSAMVAHGSSLYVLHNSLLHRVDPATGARTVLGDEDWAANESEALLIASWQEFLFVIQNGYFHRVDPANGAWSDHGEQRWREATAMVGIRTGVYVTHQSGLFVVKSSGNGIGNATEANPNNRDVLERVQAMTSIGEVLYLVNHENRMVRVDRQASPRVARLGTSTFPETQAMTSIDGDLYVWSRGLLYRMDPRQDDPKGRALDDASVRGPVSMAAIWLRTSGSGGLPTPDA